MKERRAPILDMDILEKMNCDDELTQSVKNYLNQECGNISEICLAVAAISDHLLALIDPDFCGITDYHEFWVEPSHCSVEMYDAIDKAFEKSSI